VDAPDNGMVLGLVRHAWGSQLSAAQERGLHKETLHLLVGSVFKMWPRIASILGGSLQVKLITTTDGRQLGGLLAPSTIPLPQLSYGLKARARAARAPLRVGVCACPQPLRVGV
jgi:hypothetical protein